MTCSNLDFKWFSLAARLSVDKGEGEGRCSAINSEAPIMIGK